MIGEDRRGKLLDFQVALIGAVLIAPEIAGELFATVPEEDFLDPTYRALYCGCQTLWRDGKRIDPIMLAGLLGKDSRETIIGCMDVTPSATAWKQYAARLREEASLFRLRGLGLQLAEAESLEDGLPILQDGLRLYDRRTGKTRMTLAEGFDMILHRMEHPDETRKAIPLGFSALNGRVRAYPGKFLILGGYPSSGKTALALLMALAASRSYRVGFFSLETDFEDFYSRLASACANVSYQAIQDNRFDDHQAADLRSVLPLLRSDNFVVERASRLNVKSLQMMAMAGRYDIIFIDYVQLLDSDLKTDVSPYQRVSRVSMELHRFAQDRGVAVVALSQLSREDKTTAGKSPRRPSMSDLRESGQLEQDADVVMLLDKDREDLSRSPDRILSIVKNKSGTLGTVRLAFDGETQSFMQRIQRDEPQQKGETKTDSTGFGLPKPRDRWKAMEGQEAIPPEEFMR